MVSAWAPKQSALESLATDSKDSGGKCLPVKSFLAAAILDHMSECRRASDIATLCSYLRASWSGGPGGA
jgi:hypothetical protein